MGTIVISLQREGSKEWRDCVPATCARCGREHDKVWTVTRSITPWGHFGVAVINRVRQVIDASLPTVVTKIPSDAVEVDAEQAAAWWHDDNESHVFGGPNVAKALRAAIKQANER